MSGIHPAPARGHDEQETPMTETNAATLPDLVESARLAVDTLRGIAPRVAATYTQLRETVEEIIGRWDLPPVHKREGVAEARERARRALADIQLEYATANRKIDEYVKRASTTHHEGGDPALESQRTAGWARMRDQLDNVPTASARLSAARRMIEEAIATGDRGLLEGARRELPSYLSARGVDVPEPLRVTLDEHGGPQIAKDARAFERAVKSGRHNAATAANTAVKAFDNGGPGIVPSFDGEIVRVAP